MASLGRRICWPFLTRPIGGFSFPILWPWAPTNIPSFSNLVHHRLLLILRFSSRHHVSFFFSSDAKNILFIAVCTVAFCTEGPALESFALDYSLLIILSCAHAPLLSLIQLFVTLWTIAHQTPLSKGFFRQEYWNGLPYPPPGGLPNPGIEAVSPVSPALKVDSFTR